VSWTPFQTYTHIVLTATFPAEPGLASSPRIFLLQAVHTRASVTKQYNLVSAPGGKVITVGLASHRPCVTDNSGITTYGLIALGREMSLHSSRSRETIPFYLIVHCILLRQIQTLQSSLTESHQVFHGQPLYFVLSNLHHHGISSDHRHPYVQHVQV